MAPRRRGWCFWGGAAVVVGAAPSVAAASSSLRFGIVTDAIPKGRRMCRRGLRALQLDNSQNEQDAAVVV